MKITLERSTLLPALAHVHRVVERRNTIPILSNVLIRAKAQFITFKATDLDMDVTETVEGQVAEEGAITVPAHLLHDIVRKLPDGGQVTLETVSDSPLIRVSSGKSKFQLQTLPEADFPDISADQLPVQFALTGSDLKRLIERVQFAISTEETRYYLNGIYFHTAGQSLRAVATDGHRLARADMASPVGAEDMPGIIVPRKAVGEITRLLENSDDLVEISLSDAKIELKIGHVVLTSKLIEGTFPDYERVIPTGNDRLMKVDKADFSHAVDRVSTISTERSRAVKIGLEKDKVEFTVTNPESGTANEALIADYDAAALEIGFNAKYLLDVASQIAGETIHFKFGDAGSPCLIEDSSDKSVLYVLMPMRV